LTLRGLLRRLLALRWVQRNIASFGGNLAAELLRSGAGG
jgi:carboxylesterase type B